MLTHNISHTLENTSNSYKISITIVEVHGRSRNPFRVQGWGGEPLTKLCITGKLSNTRNTYITLFYPPSTTLITSYSLPPFSFFGDIFSLHFFTMFLIDSRESGSSQKNVCGCVDAPLCARHTAHLSSVLVIALMMSSSL